MTVTKPAMEQDIALIKNVLNPYGNDDARTNSLVEAATAQYIGRVVAEDRVKNPGV